MSDRYNIDDDENDWNPRYNAFDILEQIAYEHKIQSHQIQSLMIAHNHNNSAQDDVRKENITILKQNTLLRDEINRLNKRQGDMERLLKETMRLMRIMEQEHKFLKNEIQDA
jgi:hypothetical protein